MNINQKKKKICSLYIKTKGPTKSHRIWRIIRKFSKILILILLLFSEGGEEMDQKPPCLGNGQFQLTSIGPPSCSGLPAKIFITGTPVSFTRTMLPPFLPVAPPPSTLFLIHMHYLVLLPISTCSSLLCFLNQSTLCV